MINPIRQAPTFPARCSHCMEQAWLLACGILVNQSLMAAEPSAASLPESKVAVWDFTARIESDAGYRGNVLRSAVTLEDSGFVSFSGDLSLIRLSESGAEFSVFLFGQDIEYFDAPSVNAERYASATVAYSHPVSLRDALKLEAQYLYQNQVVDASETEADLHRILVEGHSYSLRPRWEHEINPRWKTVLEVGGLRQTYVEELDDYWESSARFSVEHTYGNRSSLALSISSASWFYDSRPETDVSGTEIADSSLVYWRPETSLQWRHYWDQDRQWRSSLKVSGLVNRDSGSGYFDYDRVALRKTLRWRSSGWEITGGFRAAWYAYAEQMVGTDPRERSYYSIDLRADRQLGKRWFAYASGEHEWDFSNDPLDEYRTWFLSAGVGRDF